MTLVAVVVLAVLLGGLYLMVRPDLLDAIDRAAARLWDKLKSRFKKEKPAGEKLSKEEFREFLQVFDAVFKEPPLELPKTADHSSTPATSTTTETAPETSPGLQKGVTPYGRDSYAALGIEALKMDEPPRIRELVRKHKMKMKKGKKRRKRTPKK
jgi:hypothetical protein